MEGGPGGQADGASPPWHQPSTGCGCTGGAPLHAGTFPGDTSPLGWGQNWGCGPAQPGLCWSCGLGLLSEGADRARRGMPASVGHPSPSLCDLSDHVESVPSHPSQAPRRPCTLPAWLVSRDNREAGGQADARYRPQGPEDLNWKSGAGRWGHSAALHHRTEGATGDVRGTGSWGRGSV